MSTRTTVEIKGKQDVDKHAATASSAIRKMSGGMIKDMADLKAAYDIGAKAFRMVIDLASDAVEAYARQERATMAFTAALQTTGRAGSASANSLKAFSDQLAAMTGESDETILALETMLMTSGRTDDELKQIIETATDLSVATGKDLSSSVEQLNKTFGGTAGELGEVIPELKNLTKEQLAAGDAVDIIAGKYAGMGDVLADLTDTKLKNLGNSWENLMAAMGASVATWLDPVLVGITKIVAGWTTAIEERQRYNEIEKKSSEIKTKEDRKFELEYEIKKKQSSLDWDIANTGGMNAEYYRELLAPLRRELVDLSAGIAADKRALKALEEAAPKAAPSADSGPSPTAKKDEEEKKNEEYPSWYSAKPGPFEGGSRMGTSGASTQNSAGLEVASQASSLLGPIIDGFMGFAGSLANVKALMDPLGLVLKGFLDTLGLAINGVLQPVVDALGRVGAIAAEALFPVLEALTPIFNLLADVIIATAMPFINLLAPVIQNISGVLSIVLVPIIKALAIGLEILRAPVQFLGDLFKWVADTIKVSVHNLGEYLDHPFNAENRNLWGSPGAFRSDAFTGLGDRIKNIWSGYDPTAVAASSQGTGQTGTGASYSKPRDITVNVTINTPALVGPGGVRDFSIMIGRELQSAGILGIA